VKSTVMADLQTGKEINLHSIKTKIKSARLADQKHVQAPGNAPEDPQAAAKKAAAILKAELSNEGYQQVCVLLTALAMLDPPELCARAIKDAFSQSAAV